jgi:hypothetical protein
VERAVVADHDEEHAVGADAVADEDDSTVRRARDVRRRRGRGPDVAVEPRLLERADGRRIRCIEDVPQGIHLVVGDSA